MNNLVIIYKIFKSITFFLWIYLKNIIYSSIPTQVGIYVIIVPTYYDALYFFSAIVSVTCFISQLIIGAHFIVTHGYNYYT